MRRRERIREARLLVDYDWLVTKTWTRLHHATLSDEQYDDMWEYRQIGVVEDDGPAEVKLACGRTVTYVSIPGLFSRLGMDRCQQCCRKTGYPQGRGSPKNDDACRPLLGLPARPTP